MEHVLDDRFVQFGFAGVSLVAAGVLVRLPDPLFEHPQRRHEERAGAAGRVHDPQPGDLFGIGPVDEFLVDSQTRQHES